MAILIDSPTTEQIRTGTIGGTPLEDMSAWTCILWTKTPATITGFQHIVTMDDSTSSGGSRFLQTGGVSGGLGKIGTNVKYSGVSCFYASSFVIAASTWVYLVAAFDNGASAGDFVRHYYGTLTTLASLSTNTYADNPTGTKSADGSAVLDLGDPLNTALPAHAHQPARLFIYNSRLTAAQIVAQQFTPRPLYSGCVLYYEVGIDGITSVPDLSGNGINASVANSPTVAPHVPSGPLFGYDMGAPYVVAAASGGNPWYYYSAQAAVIG